ncbi:MAG: type II toxin-antitoxin system RelE/ParE family toxin [Gemmatimonadales bacterium]
MVTEFIETPVFTALANKLFSPADRETVTEILAENLEAGVLIPGSGGLRKLRIAGSGRGKRGGLRVIYAIRQRGETTYLIYLFAKNDTSDLSRDQYRQLSKLLD